MLGSCSGISTLASLSPYYGMVRAFLDAPRKLLRFVSGVLTDMVLRRRASQSLFELASTHELEWILLLLLQDIEEAAQIFPLDTTVPSCLSNTGALRREPASLASRPFHDRVKQEAALNS